MRSCCWLTEDLLRWPLLGDHTLVEEAHPGRDVASEAHLVGRDQHRHAGRGELADHVEHLGDELRVERARDLVEQHDVGLHRERAHDRHALLLSAGEPIGVLIGLVGEAEAVEQLARVGVGLRWRRADDLRWARA